MAANNLELLLRIIASVDGLRDIEGLREEVESIGPGLETLADRARNALNPMNGLANSARGFGEAVKESTQPLSDLATTALKVSSIAAALATALGGAVYNEAKKFESAQLDLKKVLGGTQEELDIYGQKLNALALEFGVSSNALTASMANFAQAGFSADESLALVTQSLKLKVAGDLEAGQSSEYLTRMLKGFGAQAGDSARFVDVLNEVSNQYATDVQQLAEGMSRVAPIAKLMGLSFEDTAGILTPMIESFGSGAEAAEAFKTGMLKIIDDSAPVKNALSSIGVAQTDLNGNLRNGKDILNDVMVAFQTTAESQKLFVTQQLVGIDQAPRLVEVFNQLNKVLQIQNTGLVAAGSAQQEVNIRLQSAETIGNRAAESFRQLAVALGTNYRDEVKGVVDATGSLARAFLEAEKAGSMDGLFDAVKPQLEAVENLFKQMAANLPAAFAQLDFSPLTSAITDLGGEVSAAFQAFMGSIDLTTVDGLRQAMQLIADSMAALIRFTAGAVDQMSPFFDAMGKAARFAAENADSISRLAGEVAGFSFTVNKLIPLLADMAAGVFSIIGTISEAAFKVGLLVGAVKLLNLAGIEVIPMLGRLALAIGGLNLSTATVAAAFAGFPGVLLALGAAAGTAGYAAGTVLSKGLDAAAESITGTNLGGLIYDLAEALGLENTEADRAKITQEQLAKARESHAEAAKKSAAAARETQLAEERAAKTAEELTKNVFAADEANRRLAAGFQESGLIWNKATGELTRVSDAVSGIAKPSLEVKNSLAALGIDYAQFTDSVSSDAEKLVLSFKKITEDVTASAPIISAALNAAVDGAKTVGDLEAIEAAFNNYAKTGKLSSEQVAAGHDLVVNKMKEVRAEMDPLLNLYIRYAEKVIAFYEQETAEASKNNAAQRIQIDARLALAKAMGDQGEAAKIVAEQSATIVKNAEDEIARTKEQITQTDLLINSIYAKAVANDELTPKLQASLQGMMDENAERKRTIAGIEAQIPAMQREAQQAAIMAGPVGELTRLYAEQSKEHQRAADSSERYYDAQVQEAEGALKLAQIKGDEAGQEKALAELTDRKIEQAQAFAATRAQEATDAANALSAKALELAADGELTKADQEQLAALQATVDAKRDAAQASQDTADQLQKEADASKEAADAAKKLAEEQAAAAESAAQLAAAGDAVNSNWDAASQVLAETGGNTEELQKAFIRLQEEFTRTGNALSADRFVQWAAGTALAADTVVQSFRDQKDAVENAVAALDAYTNTGQFTAQTQQALNLSTRDAQTAFNLLNDADLSNLQDAIDSAKGKMDDLRQSSEEALAAAQQTLLQEQGDTAGVLRLQQKEKELELQRRIDEARSLGDREAIANLEKARDLEQQAYEIRLKKAAADKAAADTPASNTSSPANTTGAGIRGETTQNITINVDGSDLLSEDQIRNKVLPILNRINRLNA